MFDLSLIDKYFPMASYRDGQKECIVKILDAYNRSKKVVILEAPTGSGKSAIGYTVAQYFGKSYWLTPQKILQQQGAADFGDRGRFTKPDAVMIDLKGRNAYPCTYWYRMIHDHQDLIPDGKQLEYLVYSNQKINADDGHCRRHKMAKDNFCFPSNQWIAELNGEKLVSPPFASITSSSNAYLNSFCPYWKRKYEAIFSRICLMNFSSFLYQTKMVEAFGPRDFMIVDEAHSAESVLMNFIEFTISDRHFRQRSVKFPKFDTPQEYAIYFDKIDLLKMITDIIDLAKIADDLKKQEEWENILYRYKLFMESAASGNWVVDVQDKTGGGDNVISRTVVMKPIFVNAHAQDFLFSMTNHSLLMSATILDPDAIAESLGINRDEVFALRMKSRFPMKNRPIYYQPCGHLSRNKKMETFPKLVVKVDEVCNKYPDKRGIIHTHTFEISRLLMSQCKNKSRFLFQEDWDNKDRMLEEHAKRSNSVIVAPAMHEGLDLKEDLARFAIICKIPYPSMGDPQVMARMDISKRYYDLQTALKLAQSYGRTVRSETDWADTYILDSDFKAFASRAHKLLPSWFREAVLSSSPKP